MFQIMQEASRNTDLMSQAQQLLKDADTRGLRSIEMLGKSSEPPMLLVIESFLLADSSDQMTRITDKYVLNEHLINTSRDLITQYERKAKYEKVIILTLFVVFFAVALNIMKKRLLW